MGTRLLALLDHRHRHIAESLATSGCSSSSWPSLTAQASPPGPPPTIRIPTSMRSSGTSVGGPIARLAERRREVGRADALHRPIAGPQELGELRRDLLEVADDAEVGEVENRSVRVLVDRDDRPRPLHPDLVLDRAGDAERDVELRRDGLPRLPDLRRVRVPAGIHHRAGRCDRAAERRRQRLAIEKPSGPPSPRPPATITSASSIDGPLDSSCRWSTTRACVEKSWISPDRGPPLSRRTRLGRTCPSGRGRAAASTSSPRRRAPCRRAPDACRRGRLRRARRSMRSQLSPASRRAASPAATSAASTEAAKRTFSAPDSATTASSASTRG